MLPSPPPKNTFTDTSICQETLKSSPSSALPTQPLLLPTLNSLVPKRCKLLRSVIYSPQLINCSHLGRNKFLSVSYHNQEFSL